MVRSPAKWLREFKLTHCALRLREPRRVLERQKQLGADDVATHDQRGEELCSEGQKVTDSVVCVC